MYELRPFLLALAYGFAVGGAVAYLSAGTAWAGFYVAAGLSGACIAYGGELILRRVLG